jgi:hypothetical protein
MDPLSRGAKNALIRAQTDLNIHPVTQKLEGFEEVGRPLVLRVVNDGKIELELAFRREPHAVTGKRYFGASAF